MKDASSWRPIVIHLHAIASTQDWVRDWARMGAREGIVLIARQQNAGRGRLTRLWESPPGGLYLSLLMRPRLPLARASQITMLASLAAIDACQTVAGVTPKPKWPNDLLLGRKKLAGILTETENDGGYLRYAVIGVGLNINNDFGHGHLAAIAASLRSATGRSYDVAAVANAFIEALGRRYAALRTGASPHNAWARELEPLGRRVTVQRQGAAFLSGRAESVSPEGALLVRDDAGILHTIWAGDVLVDWNAD